VPRGHVATDGGTLRFARVTGRAEVWVDGARLAVKTGRAEGSIHVALPSGGQERIVTVLIEADAGESVGFGGGVGIW